MSPPPRAIGGAVGIPCAARRLRGERNVYPALSGFRFAARPAAWLCQWILTRVRNCRTGQRTQPACQQRKWRVWRVERGRKTQPSWFSPWPGLGWLQPENWLETQIPAIVWETGGRPDTGCVNEIGWREVSFREGGSPRATKYVSGNGESPGRRILPLLTRSQNFVSTSN